ncbi:MAG: PocR ligand-binding domain-containing protein [Desulfatirhabdiaceae bacterium]|nr:PocR ligand-binding domain-containing protein [Desulfatirhabdiaceae bacterium]
MKLTDIYPIEKWTAFEKNIHEISGMDANVFNTDGIRITDYKEWVNRLCPAIKAIDKGQSYICAIAHMNIAVQAMQTRMPAIEECDAGLIKMVIPIFIKDAFVGAVGTCGLLSEDGEVDDFLINKTTDMNEDVIRELSEGIGTVSRQKAEALAAYIQQELDHMLLPFA